MADQKIGKIAHNMKFEQTWSREYLKQPVANWRWDTMLAAHVLDSRPGVCGLKFQVYVNFGVIDYDSEVAQYLKSKGKSANAHNRIMELLAKPWHRKVLLTYCGLDTLYTYRLAMDQMEQLGEIL